MPHLKALILRLYITLHHTLSKCAHGWKSVVKDLVTKVAGSAIQCCHLRSWVSISRLQSLIRSHAYCTSRRRNKNYIRADFENSLFALLETGTVLSRSSVISSYVEMDNSGTGVNCALCLSNYLIYSVWNGRILLLCYLCTAYCGGNNQLIHNPLTLSLTFFRNNAGSACAAHYYRLREYICRRIRYIRARCNHLSCLKCHLA